MIFQTSLAMVCLKKIGPVAVKTAKSYRYRNFFYAMCSFFAVSVLSVEK